MVRFLAKSRACARTSRPDRDQRNGLRSRHARSTAVLVDQAARILSVEILLTSCSRSACHVSYAACIRVHTPAPSPKSLPSRTAIAGETGLRSFKMSKRARDPDEPGNFYLAPPGGRDHFVAKQCARVRRAPIRIALCRIDHLQSPSAVLFEINAVGIAAFEFECDAPWSINMDRIAGWIESPELGSFCKMIN